VDELQLGNYFKLIWGNDWEHLTTPYVGVMFNDTGKGIGIRFLGEHLSMYYYPNGDAREHMSSYEFYEEDYDEELYEDEDHEEDTKLNKNNIALRDEIV
jgi:hypothetical protein